MSHDGSIDAEGLSTSGSSSVGSIFMDFPVVGWSLTESQSLGNAILDSLWYALLNKVPNTSDQAKVLDRVRFSLRSRQSVPRADLDVYIGYGSAFYAEGYLPGDRTDRGSFTLDRLFGVPVGLATSAVQEDGSLAITKAAGVNQNGLYFLRNSLSEALPSDPIMVGFSLKALGSGLTLDGVSSGILVGLMVGTTGLIVRFQRSGSGYIEVFDGDQSSTQRVSPGSSTYASNFEWGDNVEHTYKLLWHPEMNRVWLLSSSDLADDLLIEGQVSDFPTVPSDQLRPSLPVAFFGHGYTSPGGTSYWRNVMLHDKVSASVLGGTPHGEIEGFIRSSNGVLYTPDVAPRLADAPWSDIPTSYGQISGLSSLHSGFLNLERIEDKSLGYYRQEPGVNEWATIIDLSLSGMKRYLAPGSQSTGMEFFLNDGARVLRLAMIDTLLERFFGVLLDAENPQYAGSYLRVAGDWASQTSFRIVYFFGQWARLYLGSTLLAQVVYADLPEPDATLPAAALGFMHNAKTSSFKGDLRVHELQYHLARRPWFFPDSATDAWSQLGGVSSQDDQSFQVADASTTDPACYRALEADLGEYTGVTVEVTCRVDGCPPGSPLRSITGMGIEVDNATHRMTLAFGDAGPALGRIAFISTTGDLDEDLIQVQKGLSSAYFSVDWGEFHTYRFSRVVGGQLSVFVDGSQAASWSVDDRLFSYPLTADRIKKVRFGKLVASCRLSYSWKSVWYALGMGLDVGVNQSSVDLSRRWNNMANIVIRAGVYTPPPEVH